MLSLRSLSRVAVTTSVVTFLVVVASCAEDAVRFHTGGAIDADEMPTHGSVGFVLVDGAYHYFAMPGMEDTSINFVSADGKTAYGWARDRRYDDPEARELGFALDLVTGAYTEIAIPGTAWVVVRGATEEGVLVGKASVDAGTPGDETDDYSAGFVHDLRTGETSFHARDGYDDSLFSAVDPQGETILGANDFGAQGFVFAGGMFTDLDHPDAYRLFPAAIASNGTIVGIWSGSEETWWDNTANQGFVARREAGGYVVTRVAHEDFAALQLTGINDAGALGGIAYASASSLPVVVTARDVEGPFETHPLGAGLEPYATGINARGWVFGQIFVLEEPRACGGHGALVGDACVCDVGYLLDPYDPENCFLEGVACNGHGHTHGDTCHCDDGFRRDPEDALRCVPE